MKFEYPLFFVVLSKSLLKCISTGIVSVVFSFLALKNSFTIVLRFNTFTLYIINTIRH